VVSTPVQMEETPQRKEEPEPLPQRQVIEEEVEVPSRPMSASEKVDALIGLDILDENQPVEDDDNLPIASDEGKPYQVVKSYVRRKKPKSYRDWWDGEYYNGAQERRPVDRTYVSERTYMGHRVLPPDLSGDL